MSLYHKYRPKTLDEMYGNEATINVLRADLGKKDKPHAMLLHGPSGCGKTTLGRIIADMLGSRGGDFKEVDITDLRGIDNIREIRRQSQYRPLSSSCQVWLLDEVHRATGDAQSALLIALEEAPSHVYYLLATTDPQKLLPTILGRCSRYEVRPLGEKQMFRLLRHVVKSEGQQLTQEIYEQIIDDSRGRSRDALQVLDQVLAVGDAERLEIAKRSAETQTQVIELCRALLGRTGWKKISSILANLKNEDLEKVRYAVLGYCQSVLLKGENDEAAVVMEEFMEPFYSCGSPGLTFRCYSIARRK